MRTSIAIGTFLIVGAGATGTGAAVLSNMLGSDTLFEFTTDLITACPNVAGSLTYGGTGSGNGRDAMGLCQASAAAGTRTAGCQMIAPMSSAISVCPGKNNTSTGFVATHEGGINMAKDGVAIWGNNLTAGAAACNGTVPAAGQSCPAQDAAHGLNGAVTLHCAAHADNPATPWNEAYAAQDLVLRDWKEILSIIYAGMDSTVTAMSSDALKYQNRDCFSWKRRCLAENWSNLFTAGDSCGQDNCGSTGKRPLRHALRRDDTSGTTDVFRSLIGLPGPVTANNISPFCNAMVPSSYPNAPTGYADGNGHSYDHVYDKQETEACAMLDQAHCEGVSNGSGGYTTYPAALPSTSRPARSCYWVSGACVGSGLPLIGTGTTPDATSIRPAVNVFHAEYQDFDPIRRCAAAQPAEDAASAQAACPGGDEGLVLPVLPVDKLFYKDNENPAQTVTAQNITEAFPLAAPRANNFVNRPMASLEVLNSQTHNLAFKHNVCPNGEYAIGSQCNWPAVATTAAAADNTTANKPAVVRNWPIAYVFGESTDVDTACAPVTYGDFWRPSNADGRVYNLFLRRSSNQSFFWYDSLNHAITGAWYRKWSKVTPNACLETDATSQIGCAVSRDKWNLGYAGLQAGAAYTDISPIQVNGRFAFEDCVINSNYPLSRNLFINTLEGFDTLSSLATSSNDESWKAQLQLAKCAAVPELTLDRYASTPGTLDQLIKKHGFFRVRPLRAASTTAVNPACAPLATQLACNDVPGCFWNGSACVTGVSSPACVDYTGEAGCSNTACAALTTQATCQADAHCTWSGSACAATAVDSCVGNKTALGMP